MKKKLKRGKATGMDKFPAEVFLDGGNQMDETVLHAFNEIKEQQLPPNQWNRVGISTIYKNKGNPKKLINQRGIFLTQILSKMFERLISGRTKKITSTMSKLQAGGQDERATYDQTFLLRGFISHAKYMGTTLYLTFYDFKQCFDNLWLEDAVLSLWNLGVKSDLLPLIYKMNEESEITVRTPLGETNTFTIPCVCKQGTVLIPPMCSASVAECCEEHTVGGASIGTLHIKSLAFMDDLLDLNTTVSDVAQAHMEVDFFSKKKKMPLNESKCILMIINSKPPHPQPVLTMNNGIMNIEEETKYLGDMFNAKGNNEALIKDRTAKAIRCLVGCFSECHAVTMGCKAINSLLLLYKTVYLPTIIFNCEAWDSITKSEWEKLQVLQMKFLKRALQVPTSTPNALVLLELGLLPIEFEIKSRQLTFLHHILTREEDDPVKICYLQQKCFHFEENWANQMERTLKQMDIGENTEEIAKLSSGEWKGLVKRQVKKAAVDELYNRRNTLKKGATLEYGETLAMQPYFDKLNANNARTFFQMRTEVLDIKSFRGYKYEDNTCRLCGSEREDLEHIVNQCPGVPRHNGLIEWISGENMDFVRTAVRRTLYFLKIVEET